MLITSSGATVLVGEDKVSVAVWQCWFSKSIVNIFGCQVLFEVLLEMLLCRQRVTFMKLLRTL